ncbi:MAG: hypothetical protein OSA89_16315 [Mariniblastus sp.]|nr:hypothetical protein [Mariniblastus sp.]
MRHHKQLVIWNQRSQLRGGSNYRSVNDGGGGPFAVMEIHWETTHAKAKPLGIDADRYQVRWGRKDSAEACARMAR